MKNFVKSKLLFSLAILFFSNASYAEVCKDFDPQSPRDITQTEGSNKMRFPIAPSYKEMNLCNIHSHRNAEHKGPDFSIFMGNGKHGGYACNETGSLTKEQLKDPTNGKGAYKGVKPGDTIEVHWVYSSCDVQPGPGLSSCLTEKCSDPLLRVEAQVFLLVNDKYALDFNDYSYDKQVVKGFHQAKAIPSETGIPVVFKGSSTGPEFNNKVCSPLRVTWSVRPQCAKLNIASLHKWAEGGNVFNETYPHGTRELVTNPNLLSNIR